MIEPAPQPKERGASPPRLQIIANLTSTMGALRQLLRERPADLMTRQFSIPAAAMIFMAAFLLSALLGLVRQILLNAQFGAGSEASAFYAAFRLPDTLGNLIAGGALSSAMIPVMLRTGRLDGAEAERRLVNLVLTTLLVVVVPLALLCMIAAPTFVGTVLAPGFDADTSRLTATLTRMMLLQPPIAVAITVAIAVANSRNQFLLTALAIVVQNITLIAGIAAAAAFPGLGIYGPTLGVIAEVVLQACILLPAMRSNGFRYRPAWDLRDRHLREVIRLLIPNGLSMSVNYAGTIVDAAFASLAREAGSLPAVHNAFLLIGLPIRLLGMAIGSAAFPRLAAHAAAAEWPQMRRTLLRALCVAAGLATPILLGLILLGRPLLQILFERGRFDAAAGALTYSVLVAYAVALPAYVATEILSRGLIALYDTRTPLLTNLLQLGGRVAIILLLLDDLGVVAIPIAFAITSTLEALVLGAVLHRKLRGRMAGVAR